MLIQPLAVAVDIVTNERGGLRFTIPGIVSKIVDLQQNTPAHTPYGEVAGSHWHCKFIFLPAVRYTDMITFTQLHEAVCMIVSR